MFQHFFPNFLHRPGGTRPMQKVGTFSAKVLPIGERLFLFLFCNYSPFTDLLATWSILVFLGFLQPCRHPTDQLLQVRVFLPRAFQTKRMQNLGNPLPKLCHWDDVVMLQVLKLSLAQFFPQRRPNSFNGVEIWIGWWKLDGSGIVLAVFSTSQ